MTDKQELTELAERIPHRQDDPVYDFEHLGLKIAESLVLAAENQVTEAQNLFERTRAIADGIRAQVAELTLELAGMNGRLKTFGQQMLEAHHKFNGDGKDG